jgi:hypothetical protein
MKTVLCALRFLVLVAVPLFTLCHLPSSTAFAQQSGPCVPKLCVVSGSSGRINCFCGVESVKLRIYGDRSTAVKSLRRGESVFATSVNSRILGRGTVYLVTDNAAVAARMKVGFSITNVQTINQQVTVTIAFNQQAR